MESRGRGRVMAEAEAEIEKPGGAGELTAHGEHEGGESQRRAVGSEG